MKSDILYKIVFSILSISLVSCLQTREDIAEQEKEKQFRTQVAQMQKSEADRDAQTSEVLNDLRQLNGRVETVEHQQKLLLETQRAASQDKTEGSKEIIEQLKIFNEKMAQLEMRVKALEEGGGAKKAVKKVKSSTWQQAEKLFNKKDWINAIQLYQEYREKNPKGKYFSMATYKIGVCFQELKQGGDAKAFFQEVVQKYPKSRAAKKASYRLKSIK